MLALPDRDLVLDPLDELLERGERLAPVRCGRGGDERGVADLERSDAVHCGERHTGTLSFFGDHGGEEALSIGVRAVLERGDALPAVVVADDPAEDEDRPAVRAVDGGVNGGFVDRLLGDAREGRRAPITHRDRPRAVREPPARSR